MADNDQNENRPIEFRTEVVTLTREEMRTLMTEAIKEAFKSLGVDANSPLEVQKDMAHLRRWRMAVDSASGTSFKVMITTLIAGLMGVLWLGLQNAFK